MDDMVEVVIRLPKEDYAQYKSIAEWMVSNNFNTNNTLTKLQICIANGTVLSKGHGRLIDADAINIHDVSPAYGMEVYGVTQDDIEYEPTVIEADKEVDNE